jgi:hypothetical protein
VVSDINSGVPSDPERDGSNLASSGWVRLSFVQSGPGRLIGGPHALKLGKGGLPWWEAVELDGRIRHLHATYVVNYHEVRWWQTSFL